jgi:Holliday junction resolvasome RuvABC DNA-binding subunit
MIGYLKGEVLSSDGKKVLLKTEFGIGYEVNYAYYADVGV